MYGTKSVNWAVCDSCGKTVEADGIGQKEFLSVLRRSGWWVASRDSEGLQRVSYCEECATEREKRSYAEPDLSRLDHIVTAYRKKRIGLEKAAAYLGCGQRKFIELAHENGYRI